MATKIIKLTNQEIYNMANNFTDKFSADLVLPVKINFYMQNNMKKIMELAKEIENTRVEILERYGTVQGNRYVFSEGKEEVAGQEIKDLFELEQEVKIYLIELDWFGDIQLSFEQLSTIDFMINFEEEMEETIEIPL